MAMKFVGSLCLSDIPKSEIKVVKCNDGKERAFLSISIHENSEPRVKDGKIISDHFVSCAPKKEDRVEGVNYIFGNLREWHTADPMSAQPTPEEIEAAPSYETADGNSVDLPF